jgi:hypothetical protein
MMETAVFGALPGTSRAAILGFLGMIKQALRGVAPQCINKRCRFSLKNRWKPGEND